MSEEHLQPVTQYLQGLTEPRRERIESLYATARALAPDAVEGMKYAMPALVLNGKGLVSVISTKKHVGLYPYSSALVAQFAAELEALGVSTSKGAIQIPDHVELPAELVTRIIQARVAELSR